MFPKLKLFTIYHKCLSYNFKPTNTELFLKNTNLLTNHNYINNERQNSNGILMSNKNPATGAILTTINECTITLADECIKSAILAQKKWSRYSITERSKVLIRAAELIRKKSETIAIIDVLDTGKPFWESLNDVNACADSVQMFGSLLYSFDGTFVPHEKDSFYYTRREPLGVCVGIGSWNFPFQMMTWKSAPAIAAGNSFIFKPSSLTPMSAIILAEIYEQAGTPKGLVSVLQGDKNLGNHLCTHPDISKLSFTGSVKTGKHIMSAASDTLKHLTLELGGKSPLIIFQDADINESIKGTIVANFLSQGEVCSNGTRVYIHRNIYENFEKKLVEAVKTLKIGDPFDPAVAIGAIISEDQYKIVLEYINSAKSEGAKIIYGGTQVVFPESTGLSGGKYIIPCIISNCDENMRVVKEEIFGPVLCLMPFETEEEVIQKANNSLFGLCGGLFTKDLNRAHRVASKLQCGTVYINTYNAYPIGIPFGGTKMSGFGRENCRLTLDSYSQIKSTFVESNNIDYPFWPTKN